MGEGHRVLGYIRGGSDMRIGTLVKYKDLSTPLVPCGHHRGHKYGMVGIVTGQYRSRSGEIFYSVEWANPSPNLEQTHYTKVRLEVVCE